MVDIHDLKGGRNIPVGLAVAQIDLRLASEGERAEAAQIETIGELRPYPIAQERLPVIFDAGGCGNGIERVVKAPFKTKGVEIGAPSQGNPGELACIRGFHVVAGIVYARSAVIEDSVAPGDRL